MFVGLSGMEWLFIVAALAFGFGVVKFMMSQRSDSANERASVPSVQPGESADVRSFQGFGGAGMQQLSSLHGAVASSLAPDLLASGASNRAGASPASPSRAWFEVLGVSEWAGSEEIEKAANTLQALGVPDSVQKMLIQLRTVREAVREGRSVSDIDQRIESIERQLCEMTPLLMARVREIEAARIEGMERLLRSVVRPR